MVTTSRVRLSNLTRIFNCFSRFKFEEVTNFYLICYLLLRGIYLLARAINYNFVGVFNISQELTIHEG